jgi:hypothetical protein
VRTFIICLTTLSVVRLLVAKAASFSNQQAYYIKYMSQQKTTAFSQDEMRHRPAKM